MGASVGYMVASAADQPTYEPFGITKSYFQVLFACDLSSTSIAAKVTSLAAPIIALITLFADLIFALANCLFSRNIEPQVFQQNEEIAPIRAIDTTTVYFYPSCPPGEHIDPPAEISAPPAIETMRAEIDADGSAQEELSNKKSPPPSPSHLQFSTVPSDDEGENPIYYSDQGDNDDS